MRAMIPLEKKSDGPTALKYRWTRLFRANESAQIIQKKYAIEKIKVR